MDEETEAGGRASNKDDSPLRPHRPTASINQRALMRIDQAILLAALLLAVFLFGMFAASSSQELERASDHLDELLDDIGQDEEFYTDDQSIEHRSRERDVRDARNQLLLGAALLVIAAAGLLYLIRSINRGSTLRDAAERSEDSRRLLDELDRLDRKIEASQRSVNNDIGSDVSLDADELAAAARSHLRNSFEQYGQLHARSATALLSIGITTLIGSAFLAYTLVLGLPNSSSTAEVLTRAAVAIPGTTLFAVMVRESANRRRHAAWGRLTAIQAETLGPYARPLPENLRNELLMEFGRAVFRGGDVALESDGLRPDKQNRDPGAPEVTDAYRAAIDALKTAAEVQSALLGPRNTAKSSPGAGADSPVVST